MVSAGAAEALISFSPGPAEPCGAALTSGGLAGCVPARFLPDEDLPVLTCAVLVLCLAVKYLLNSFVKLAHLGTRLFWRHGAGMG